MFGVSMASRVGRHVEAVRDVVAGLDADAVPVAEAPGLWETFDALERLGAAGKLLLARRVDESGVWQRAGDRSAAEWMARRSGCSTTAERARLTTSKRLAKLALTAAALRRGELSGPQTEAIADAVAHNPAVEADLLELVERSTLAELRAECLRAKAAADPDPDTTYRRIHRERRLRQHTDAEGAWCLHARSTADVGAEFNAALEPLIDQLFRAARARGDHEHREAYAFDALAELIRRSFNTDQIDDEIDQTNDAGSGSGSGESTEVPAGPEHPDGAPIRPNRTQRRRRRGSRNPRYQALIRADLAALVRGRVDGDELCEISGVGPIPVSQARRLLGDAVLKLVLTRGVDVLNVTHLGRGPTVAQRIALLWTSPTCSVEGCTSTFVQHDHREDWARTHHTRLDELDRLCTHHHDLKTRLGWALVAGTGKRRMVPPDHPGHPDHPDNATTKPKPQAA